MTVAISDSVSVVFERWERVRRKLYHAELGLAEQTVSRSEPARIPRLQDEIATLQAEAEQLFAAAMRMLAHAPSANDPAESDRRLG
jgi:hypothetical protein